MRTFTDAEGRPWQVVVGRESWGSPVLLFTREDEHEVRQAPLAAETMLDAARVVDEFSEDELRDKLAGAGEWG